MGGGGGGGGGGQWRKFAKLKMAKANSPFSFVKFAISPCPPPSDPVIVKLDTAANRKTKQSITQVKKCRPKLVCITAVIMLRALTYALTYCNCMK